MAKGDSGGIWKIAATVLIVISMAASIIIAFTNVDNRTTQNEKEIEILVPQVNKNTEHRLQDDVDTRYVKEKLAAIDTKMTQILEEIRTK